MSDILERAKESHEKHVLAMKAICEPEEEDEKQSGDVILFAIIGILGALIVGQLVFSKGVHDGVVSFIESYVSESE